MSCSRSRGGVLSQHVLQVVSQHALQQVSGGGVLSQHALQVVSQHALQQVSRGGSAPRGRGCLLPGGACLVETPSGRPLHSYASYLSLIYRVEQLVTSTICQPSLIFVLKCKPTYENNSINYVKCTERVQHRLLGPIANST